MALEGFKIGKNEKPTTGAPTAAPSTSGSGALKGFAIGKTASKPAVATQPVPIPQKIQLPDPSSFLSKSLSFANSFGAPTVTPKTQTSTPNVAQRAPSTIDDYSGLPLSPVGDTLSSANPTNKPESFISKTINNVKDFVFGESPDKRAANNAVQKSIVDNNAYAIGKQLGIDKQFPLDPKKDPITAEYNQKKQVATYIKENWNTIKSGLENPDALPEHPEMLGPKYADVQKNFDAYEKKLGLRDTPTVKEALSAALLAPVAGAIIETGAIPVALGFAGFTAFSWAEHKILGDSLAGKASDKLGFNSNVRDALDLIEMFGVGYGLHSAYLKAPEFSVKWTKNIVENYMPGQKIAFEPEQVFDMLSGKNKITTSQQREIFNKLGLTSEQMKQAKINGVPVDISPEKILTLVDKPYWSKIKSLFRVVSRPQEIGRTTLGETKVGPENRSNRLLGDGLVKTEEGALILQQEIKDSIIAHGEDLTLQSVQQKLNLDPAQALRVVNEAKAAKTPEELKQTSQDILESKIGPQTKALKEFKVNEKPVLADDVKTADSMRAWINTETKLPEDVMGRLKGEKIGVDELPFNDSGEITLYRDKTPKAGEIESYSLNQKVSQEPYTIKKSQVIANTGSKAMAEIFEKAYPKGDEQSLANKEMLKKYSKLESEIFVRNTKEITPPVEGIGETKTRGLSQGVEEKAISNKLTDSLGDLPEYKTVNMKDQAARATELLKNDYEKAKQIAMGHELAPEGLLPESVFVAVEERAIKNGDINTLRDLATASNLSAEATTMGQRIRTLGERNPDSPVRAIREISEARQKKALKGSKNNKEAKKKVVSEIKKKIKKAVPAKQTWADFVDSITC